MLGAKFGYYMRLVQQMTRRNRGIHENKNVESWLSRRARVAAVAEELFFLIENRERKQRGSRTQSKSSRREIDVFLFTFNFSVLGFRS